MSEKIILPALALRDMVVYPYMVVPLFVGREKSVAALEEAINKKIDIILVSQRDPQVHNPKPSELYDFVK